MDANRLACSSQSYVISGSILSRHHSQKKSYHSPLDSLQITINGQFLIHINHLLSYDPVTRSSVMLPFSPPDRAWQTIPVELHTHIQVLNTLISATPRLARWRRLVREECPEFYVMHLAAAA